MDKDQKEDVLKIKVMVERQNEVKNHQRQVLSRRKKNSIGAILINLKIFLQPFLKNFKLFFLMDSLNFTLNSAKTLKKNRIHIVFVQKSLIFLIIFFINLITH